MIVNVMFDPHSKLSIKLDDKTRNFDRENTCGLKQQNRFRIPMLTLHP